LRGVVAHLRTPSGRDFLPGEAIARDVLLRVGVSVAALHRRRLRRTTFVGITGSGGKTSTKELVAAVLGSELRGTKSPGAENRLSDVGRTILRTRADDDYCVAEVATWRPGTIAEIAHLLRPQIGVVTNVGIEHFKQTMVRHVVCVRVCTGASG